MISVLAVTIYQFNRENPDIRDIEHGDAGSNRNWPMTSTTVSSKRKKRRKKTRKSQARDSDTNVTIDPPVGSKRIEEAVSFEEDTVPLQINVGTRDVSGTEQHVVDISKVSNSAGLLVLADVKR